METPKSSSTPIGLYVVGVLVVIGSAAAAILLRGGKSNAEQREVAARTTEVDAGPRVLVAQVVSGAGARDALLQGEAKPLLATTLYAKTSGYVREVPVNKGSLVKQGQLLARLESPETEQAVAEAQTQVVLRKQLAQRAAELSASGVMSKQDLEQADAALKTAQTELTRSSALRDYVLLRAPFDGVVTARYVDPGALVPAATGATQSAMPVVEVAKVDTLKVVVYLGQDMAPFVRIGDEALLWQDEQPGKKIDGKVTLMSGQLDSKTRTELTEIWFDNRAVKMIPGTFVRIKLSLHVPALPTVPAEAVLSRGGRLLVGVVEGAKLQLVPVEVGNSDGRSTEITAGLKGSELVALDLPTELGSGDTIQPVLRKPTGGGADKGPEPAASRDGAAATQAAPKAKTAPGAGTPPAAGSAPANRAEATH